MKFEFLPIIYCFCICAKEETINSQNPHVHKIVEKS